VPDDAHAYWLTAPGCGQIRPVAPPEPGMMERLASGSLPALCHTITYDRE
jgi:hypothetical protein